MRAQKISSRIAGTARSRCAALSHSRSAAGRVHDLRVRVKFLRSLLRLLGAIGLPGHRALDRRLQKIAQRFSQARDAAITRDWLVEHRFPIKPVRTLSHGGKRLLQAEAELATLEAELLASVRAFPLAENALRSALGRSARKARMLWRRAARTGSDHDFHSWRKRTKNLQYQFAALGGAPASLVALGKRLGRVQDRVVVRSFLGRLPRMRWVAEARSTAQREKNRLQRKAIKSAPKALPKHPRRWALKLFAKLPR